MWPNSVCDAELNFNILIGSYAQQEWIGFLPQSNNKPGEKFELVAGQIAERIMYFKIIFLT